MESAEPDRCKITVHHVDKSRNCAKMAGIVSTTTQKEAYSQWPSPEADGEGGLCFNILRYFLEFHSILCGPMGKDGGPNARGLSSCCVSVRLHKNPSDAATEKRAARLQPAGVAPGPQSPSKAWRAPMFMLVHCAQVRTRKSLLSCLVPLCCELPR